MTLANLNKIINNYNYQHKDKPVSIPKNNMELYKTILYMQNNMLESELRELEKIKLPKPKTIKELDIYRDCVDIYTDKIKITEFKDGKLVIFDKKIEEFSLYFKEHPEVGRNSTSPIEIEFQKFINKYNYYFVSLTTLYNGEIFSQSERIELEGIGLLKQLEIPDLPSEFKIIDYSISKEISWNISKKSNKNYKNMPFKGVNFEVNFSPLDKIDDRINIFEIFRRREE